jgi:RNA ligase (TIGR02306 family)
MSTLFAEIVSVDSIHPHPNAERLDIIKIKGTQTIVPKGSFAPGDKGVYFPPDILISDPVADRLGVAKFLKSAQYEENKSKSRCRVAACRLRGIPSYGFLIPTELTDPVGTNVNDLFEARKYEPPIVVAEGEQAEEYVTFHRYSSPEHFWKFPDVIAEGEPVCITEKIHGTNCRVGVIRGLDGLFHFMAGSHRVNRKQFDAIGRESRYWKPHKDHGVQALLDHLRSGDSNVILFGELFGRGVQDMDYGITDGFRAFDISVRGEYLDYQQFADVCDEFNVSRVPELYVGSFRRDLLDLTDGPTYLAEPNKIASPFKGREGIVIKPLANRYNETLGGRVILKSVSADYLDRKGAEDNE